ncbi:MAG: DUF2227 family putative metal-binding protein [Candidatus Bipolaricaulota bacterium]
MPSGKVHLALDAAALVVLASAGAALVVRRAVPVTLAGAFLGGYAFSMIFLSPDLDLARSHGMQRWGPLAFLWRPYAAWFRHRGLSHHPLWGPLSRLGYLALLVVAAFLVAQAALGRQIVRPVEGVAALGLAAVGGAYASNLLHIAADAVGAWRVRCRRSTR